MTTASASAAAPETKLTGKGIGVQHYATRLGIYDEMLSSEHKMLPYWESFIKTLEEMGGEELESRRREAQRLLRENGVTYNVYGDGHELARPWRLDPIPLLISNEEWKLIESGLKQRAKLLDLILKDLYGKQTLLKKGLLPCELVFAHQGFLHACMGTIPKHGKQLSVYAANLVRGSKGRIWTLDDRTQAPSGSGYALENRAVMLRILPDILKETRVNRLSGFFKIFSQRLAHMALHNKDNPRVVVLTPGPFNETYFEHAYLASYLGYTLVQGDDLAVRDGYVWLKSLEGLQPVDVILRRVDDNFCDPLSLRNDSRLGVPGLLEAVRRGNVAVVNPLGSSVLENTALLAFLPSLAQHFLGQDLILPSVATWWCGQKRERDFVLANLDKLIIKHVNRRQVNDLIIGDELDGTKKEQLRAAILAKPHLYVGQEKFNFSTIPSFIDHQIEPRNAVMRGFVVADDEGYQVMPGGLTRVARDKQGVVVSNQVGGISKDTWILVGDSEVAAPRSEQISRTLILNPVSEALTSRAADHLFWVGRYAERIDCSARLLRTILSKYRYSQEYKDDLDEQCLAVLLPALDYVTGARLGFAKRLPIAPQELLADLLAMAKDAKRTGSLSANIHAWNHAAFSVRDLWSQDTWRSVDSIQHRWRPNNMTGIEPLQTGLDELVTGIATFTGLINESMTREAGWLMLDSGRKLERALLLAALLRGTLQVKHGQSLLQQVLEAVLVATDSFSVYQRRYRAVLQLPLLLELLLFDPSHPRSVAYQLEKLSGHIAGFPRETSKAHLSVEERLILKAYTDVRLGSVDEVLATTEEAWGYDRLGGLLDSTGQLLVQLSSEIAQAYFNHANTAQVVSLQTLTEDEL